MRLNGNNKWAFVLIVIGSLLLLNFLGPGIASLFNMLFPIALIALGYIGVKNGKLFIGWTLLIIGLISFLSSMGGFLGLVFAAALIGFGVSMLLKKRNVY